MEIITIEEHINAQHEQLLKRHSNVAAVYGARTLEEKFVAACQHGNPTSFYPMRNCTGEDVVIRHTNGDLVLFPAADNPILVPAVRKELAGTRGAPIYRNRVAEVEVPEEFRLAILKPLWILVTPHVLDALPGFWSGQAFAPDYDECLFGFDGNIVYQALLTK